jgi:transcription-repair coupling factor (superfamily II helicase)
MIYSGIPHTTAALFLSGNFIEQHERICIITDDMGTKKCIEESGSWILGQTLRTLRNPGEIIGIHQYEERILLIHTHTLKVSGNQENIKRNHCIEISLESIYPQNSFIEKLLEFGYKQSNYPGESGTYKREGSIIRIWKEDREYLIEYFDDTIESIIEMTSTKRIHRNQLLFFPENPYLSSESSALSQELLLHMKDMPTLMIGCEFLEERDFIYTNFRNKIEFSSVRREGSQKIDITLPKLETLPEFLEYIESEKSEKKQSLCISRYEKKLREFLDINHATHIKSLEYKHLHESFQLKESSALLGQKWKPYIHNNAFSLIADDILGKIFIQNRVRKNTIKNLDLLLRIKEGDLVVHREHGIGRYVQILKKRIGLIEREYMEIEYRSSDRVYVPMTEIARITKYVGDNETELSSLEGKEWERVLSKTDEEIQAIAEDILETDAKRTLTTRIPFGKFAEEEERFRKAFPHIHTPDQASIIADILSDMEGPHPMDRLIAGDVGFGKTEVAMNAVYKAVLS